MSSLGVLDDTAETTVAHLDCHRRGHLRSVGHARLEPPGVRRPGGLPVTITVTSSMNPSSFDQGVMYTATLTTSDLMSIDPADTVAFQDGGNDINGCNSQLLSSNGMAGMFTATCSEPSNNMSVGAHDITALFGGDSTYAQGSGSMTQNVNPAADDHDDHLPVARVIGVLRK